MEIELKACCRDREAILKRILDIGAEFRDSNEQIDIYFKHPCRDFAETDEAFRIRRTDNKNVLTYKGPKLKSRVKSRVEIETDVSDFKSLVAILENLGFIPGGDVKKNRESYILGDIRICLDHVEGLGNYVEIEKNSDDLQKTEQELLNLAERLSLTEFEKRSYLEMILEL